MKFILMHQWEQAVKKVHNLMYLVEGNTNLVIYYPYFKKGILISIVGLLVFSLYIYKYEYIRCIFIKCSKNILERNNYSET